MELSQTGIRPGSLSIALCLWLSVCIVCQFFRTKVIGIFQAVLLPREHCSGISETDQYPDSDLGHINTSENSSVYV